MVCGATLFLLRKYILACYTINLEVLEKSNNTMVIIVLFLFVDCVRGVLKGTAKAMGIYRIILY